MTLKSKLMVAIVMVAVATLLFAVFTVGVYTNKEARAVVAGSVANRLVALRAVQVERVESYFANMTKIVTYTAENPATVVALEGFSSSFTLSNDLDDTYLQDITEFYQNDYVEHLQAYDARVTAQTLAPIVDALDNSAIFFQTRYIARNEATIGNKSELMMAPKVGRFTARYENNHFEHHTILKQVKDEFGFSDIYLVDTTGRIVYSTEKNIDFATSLTEGPFSNSALAEVWLKSQTLEPKETVLSDFTSYLPANYRSVIFIAAPVFVIEKSGSDSTLKRAGSFIVQLDNSQVTSVLTSNAQWQAIGLGETGEAYLVGSDSRLRTQSRFLMEDEAFYFNQIQKTSSQMNFNDIRARNSSVGWQTVANEAVEKALQGEQGVVTTESYFGEPVLAAYGPLSIKENNWGIVVEITQRELFAEINKLFQSAIVYSLIVLMIAIALSYGLGAFVSRIIINPIKSLVASFRNIAEGDGDLRVHLDTANRKDEVGELSSSFNAFVNNIHNVVQEVVHTSDSLRTVANSLSDNTIANADNMNQQRQLTKLIATSVNDFTVSIGDIVDNSHRAQQSMVLAESATSKGRNASLNSEAEMGLLAKQTETSVTSIRVLSAEIDSITQILATINSISEQTSLLALNAAIEAARAGEQGRGFAVVADEVRNLSSRTQQATVDIQQRIHGLATAAETAVQQVEASKTNADSGIQLAKETVEELEKVKEIVIEVKALNDAIDSLVTQQHAAVQQIEINIGQIEQMSDTAVLKTDQAKTSTTNLLDMANTLSSIVSRFKVNR